MKWIIGISRIIGGLVFVFSGFVKAVDPAGSAIKFEEYFEAFHLGFLGFSAMPLSILLSSAELMIGLNMVFKVRIRFTAWLMLVFMIFFTLLTFFLAIGNPVSDCGCFGDALKLTNWQTFGKNLILLLPVWVVFMKRNLIVTENRPCSGWSLAIANLVFSASVSFYSLVYQPILDFRPYRTGTHIPSQMTIPEGAPMDEYETILVYEKNGTKQEFNEQNFPWQDTTWKWVETRQKLLKKGYEPPIHDFSITLASGEDITEQVLADANPVLLIISPRVNRSQAKAVEKMNHLAMRAKDLGWPVYCLTASTAGQIEDFRKKHEPVFDICTSDETTLKTISRAKTGLVLLQRGVIAGKWNHTQLPDADNLTSQPLSDLLGTTGRKAERMYLLICALVVFLLHTGVGRMLKR